MDFHTGSGENPQEEQREQESLPGQGHNVTSMDSLSNIPHLLPVQKKSGTLALDDLHPVAQLFSDEKPQSHKKYIHGATELLMEALQFAYRRSINDTNAFSPR